MSKTPYCDTKSCLRLPKYCVQSIKKKAYSCEEHLVECIEDLSGKELYVIKIDFYAGAP